MMRNLLIWMLAFWATVAVAADEGLVVIGHASLGKADVASLQRVYTGRAVSLGAVAVVPVNLPAGIAARQQFLETVMGQTEDQYAAYWLVRRYVGKGAPPQELDNIEEVIAFVRTTPGAIGYIPAARAPTGSNVIFRRQP